MSFLMNKQPRPTSGRSLMALSLGWSMMLISVLVMLCSMRAIIAISNDAQEHVDSLPSSSRESHSESVGSWGSSQHPRLVSSRSHCFYREFPFTQVNDGLPWLFDAFADHEVEHAVFLGIHRREIYQRYAESDSIFTSDPETGRTHHLLCMFQGNIPVWSEAVHRPAFKDNARPWAHERVFAIRCKIPPQVKSLIQQGQRETELHVDLVALLHPNNKTLVEKSHMVAELPTISNIPICHSMSNAADLISTQLKSKQFKFIAQTEIKTGYTRENNERVEGDTFFRIHEFIHYHHYQGIQHFIIYDNNENEQNQLKEELAPYVEQGLVTRIWNPMVWHHPENDPKRNTKTHSQGLRSVSALFRFGHITDFVANMDIDEFFILEDPKRRLVHVVQAFFSQHPRIDGTFWMPYVISYCNGTVMPASELDGGGGGGSSMELNRKTILATKQCKTTSRLKGTKTIFLADRIWFYHTHSAFMTSNLTKPRYLKIPEEVGYLGHFRSGAYRTSPVDDQGNVVVWNDQQHPNPSMAMLEPYLQARDKEQLVLRKTSKRPQESISTPN